MKKALFTAIAIFMIFVSANAQTSSPLYINPYPKTISVTGSAFIEIIPDEIFVQVDLREYEKKGAGKTDIEKIKAKFLEACKSTGLADSSISVVSYQGMDRLHWLYKKRKAPDMTASISYQVKFNNTRQIEAFIEKLDDEATQNFFVAKTSHSKIEELRKQLKIQAVKAAKEKAGYLAEAIGEKIGEAVTVTEPSEQTEMPYVNQIYTANTRMLMQANTTDQPESDAQGIDFRKIKIRFEVNAVFAIK